MFSYDPVQEGATCAESQAADMTTNVNVEEPAEEAEEDEGVKVMKAEEQTLDTRPTADADEDAALRRVGQAAAAVKRAKTEDDVVANGGLKEEHKKQQQQQEEATRRERETGEEAGREAAKKAGGGGDDGGDGGGGGGGGGDGGSDGGGVCVYKHRSDEKPQERGEISNKF